VQITLNIIADTFDELHDALAEIARKVGKGSDVPTPYTITAAPMPLSPGVGVSLEDKPAKAPRAKKVEAAPAPAPAPAPLVPGVSQKDAKAQALDILRECFALEKAPGDALGTKKVKALMAEMGVDKFVKVPDERGSELLQRALEIKSSLTGSASAEIDTSQDGAVADQPSDTEEPDDEDNNSQLAF
jgi:hypothetical protein